MFFVNPLNKDNTDRKFIESVIKKSAEKNSLKVSFAKDENMESQDSAYYKAKIDIIKLRTSYPRFGKNTFLGEKTLVREISSDLAVEIKHHTASGGAATVIKDNITTIYKGEIQYDDFEQYQTESYKFTQSVPPDISFLESIIFPAAIVLVSAAATILFFTIRSK